MDIDKRVKDYLEQEKSAQSVPDMYQSGLMGMILPAFQGAMRRWVIMVNIVTLLVSALMVWCGYRFFTTESELVFWGVCLVISLQAQIALKQWLWQEMHRNNLLMEIKRLLQSQA